MGAFLRGRLFFGAGPSEPASPLVVGVLRLRGAFFFGTATGGSSTGADTAIVSETWAGEGGAVGGASASCIGIEGAGVSSLVASIGTGVVVPDSTTELVGLNASRRVVGGFAGAETTGPGVGRVIRSVDGGIETGRGCREGFSALGSGVVRVASSLDGVVGAEGT